MNVSASLSVGTNTQTPGMRLSKQALAFLKYLYDAKATQDHEDPESFGKISGFIFSESDENWEWGARGEKVMKRGSRYNSVHRIVLKLYRNGYVIRRAHGRALGYDYKINEKGLDALRKRGIIGKI
jgi:hypothetical protein